MDNNKSFEPSKQAMMLAEMAFASYAAPLVHTMRSTMDTTIIKTSIASTMPLVVGYKTRSLTAEDIAPFARTRAAWPFSLYQWRRRIPFVI